ncbi:MAG: DUF5335 family protein [Candidatus Promineifilaceae bacterium]|nr:DUF5335 family protein [Candidatus Promineifilaceae bacterium]
MSEESPRFKSENLPKYRWQTFFAELLEGRKGQPVNILEGSDFLHTEIPTDTAPLEDIIYDSKHRGTLKHKGYLEIKTGGPEGETVAVDTPTIVWVYQNMAGIVIGIEVIDEENNRVAVRFA